MSVIFKIVPKETYNHVIDLVFKLGNDKVSKDLLSERFEEMKHQNYECAGIYKDEILIGITGLWFSTRHYIGKSVELDHVYIEDAFRNQGIGKQFMSWIQNYISAKGCKSMELNTYVQNYPSHKFYYNEGFEILGYHFLKKL